MAVLTVEMSTGSEPFSCCPIFSSLRSQFVFLQTNSKLVNNIFIFNLSFLSNHSYKIKELP